MRGGAVRRSGVITLELLVSLPLLVILLLALIEFAIIYQVNMEVAEAARFGAKLASEITRLQAAATNLGNYNQAATVSDLKERIDQYLANNGLTASCEVILQHGACVPNQTQLQPTSIPPDCLCTTPATPFPNSEPPAGECYARVTVALRLDGNVPNLLSTFGLDLGDMTVQQSTVFRIETNNLAPTVSSTGTLITSPVNYTVLSGSFPMSCGSSVTLGNALGTVVAGTFVVISFDASATTDPEEPNTNLTFSWTGSGAGTNPLITPTNNTGTTYVPLMRRPPDPNTNGATTEADNVNTYTITLTVTDSCNTAAVCVMTVVLRTRDSDPAP
jgi:hypothetical protein